MGVVPEDLEGGDIQQPVVQPLFEFGQEQARHEQVHMHGIAGQDRPVGNVLGGAAGATLAEVEWAVRPGALLASRSATRDVDFEFGPRNNGRQSRSFAEILFRLRQRIQLPGRFNTACFRRSVIDI